MLFNDGSCDSHASGISGSKVWGGKVLMTPKVLRISSPESSTTPQHRSSPEGHCIHLNENKQLRKPSWQEKQKSNKYFIHTHTHDLIEESACDDSITGTCLRRKGRCAHVAFSYINFQAEGWKWDLAPMQGVGKKNRSFRTSQLYLEYPGLFFCLSSRATVSWYLFGTPLNLTL